MPRHTNRNLAAASIGVLAMMLCAEPAAAEQQNACGELVDGEVSCPAQGVPFDQGIRYDAPGNIVIHLEDGLEVAPEAGLGPVMAVSQVGSGGSVVIDGAGASVAARGAIGVNVEAEGDIVIDIASVSTEVDAAGAYAFGIHTASAFGSTSINAGSIATVGDYSSGIVAQSFSGGAVTISAGSISTRGFASDGIALLAGGLVDIRVDSIEGTGDYIWGVNVTNGVETVEGLATDDTSVDVGRIRLSGNYNAGVVLQSYSSALVHVGDLDVEGFASTGVHAAALDSARVYVDNAVFRGEQTGGIIASAGTGDAYVNVGTLTSEWGIGAAATSFAGTATIEAGSVHVGGDLAPAIQVGSTYGNAAVRVGDVSTIGAFASAIAAQAWRGEIDIRAGDVATGGIGSYGIDATGRTNNIVLQGALTTTGDRGIGILSATTRGDNDVLVTGNVTTSGAAADGLWVVGRYGNAAVRAIGAIATSGEGSAAIRATGEDGAVVVEAQNVTTSGVGSTGIQARTRFVEFYLGYLPGEPVPFTGNIDIRAANVAVSGAGSKAISAKGIGDAQILAGHVSAVSGEAIETDMIGDVTIALRGNVRSETANAIVARGSDVSIDIAAAAKIFGGQDALVIDAVGPRCVLREPDDGSSNPCPNPGADGHGNGIGVRAAPAVDFPGFSGHAHVVNRGTIEAGEGFAVRVVSGSITLANEGQIVGGVQFAGGDDRFDNTGVFFLDRDSDFGGGSDLLRNSGVVRAAGGELRLAGLERFENGGTIDLGNGAVGDMLTLAGDYVGLDGAIVRLDIDGAGSKADRLVIEGSASGSTLIALAADPAEAELTSADGVILIEVAGSATDGAFALEQSTRDIGLVRYSLAYDAEAGAYSLVGRAGAGAYRQLGVLQAADDIWDASAGVWRLHGLSRRDTLMAGREGAGAARLWGALHGARASRDWTTEADGEAMALDYRQTRRGGQLGYDLVGAGGDAGSFRAGLTAGYSSARLGYRGADERIALSSANVGAYASYVGERLFANLLVKYDRHDVKIDSAAFAEREKLDGSTWGAEGEVGFRFGGEDMFVEPAAGLAWTSSRIDDIDTGTQQLAFEDSNQVRARLGARFGGTSLFASGGMLTLYASANAVRLIGDDYGLAVTSGASQRIAGDRLGTYGEGRLGIAYRTAGGFEAFAEGQGEVGDGYDALGGRVGFRIGF